MKDQHKVNLLVCLDQSNLANIEVCSLKEAHYNSHLSNLNHYHKPQQNHLIKQFKNPAGVTFFYQI